jgi:hypothetical protein
MYNKHLVNSLCIKVMPLVDTSQALSMFLYFYIASLK